MTKNALGFNLFSVCKTLRVQNICRLAASIDQMCRVKALNFVPSKKFSEEKEIKLFTLQLVIFLIGQYTINGVPR